MTVRNIPMTKGAVLAICNALNLEASHFDGLAADARFANQPTSVACFREKADDNRTMARQLLFMFRGPDCNTNPASEEYEGHMEGAIVAFEDQAGPVTTHLEAAFEDVTHREPTGRPFKHVHNWCPISDLADRCSVCGEERA